MSNTNLRVVAYNGRGEHRVDTMFPGYMEVHQPDDAGKSRVMMLHPDLDVVAVSAIHEAYQLHHVYEVWSNNDMQLKLERLPADDVRLHGVEDKLLNILLKPSFVFSARVIPHQS